MKKNIFTFCFFIMSTLFFSQGKKIGEYLMNNSKYAIRFIADREEFVIDVPSKDNYAKNTRLILTENQRADFVSRIDRVKAKFIEWKELSIKNNITTIVKDFSTPNIDYNVSFEIDDESFLATKCTSNFSFIVNEGKSYLVFTNLSPISDFENSYIKSQGYMLAFENELEIKNFVFWLNPIVAKLQIEKDKADILK